MFRITHIVFWFLALYFKICLCRTVVKNERNIISIDGMNRENNGAISNFEKIQPFKPESPRKMDQTSVKEKMPHRILTENNRGSNGKKKHHDAKRSLLLYKQQMLQIQIPDDNLDLQRGNKINGGKGASNIVPLYSDSNINKPQENYFAIRNGQTLPEVPEMKSDSRNLIEHETGNTIPQIFDKLQTNLGRRVALQERIVHGKGIEEITYKNLLQNKPKDLLVNTNSKDASQFINVPGKISQETFGESRKTTNKQIPVDQFNYVPVPADELTKSVIASENGKINFRNPLNSNDPITDLDGLGAAGINAQNPKSEDAGNNDNMEINSAVNPNIGNRNAAKSEESLLHNGGSQILEEYPNQEAQNQDHVEKIVVNSNKVPDSTLQKTSNLVSKKITEKTEILLVPPKPKFKEQSASENKQDSIHIISNKPQVMNYNDGIRFPRTPDTFTSELAKESSFTSKDDSKKQSIQNTNPVSHSEKLVSFANGNFIPEAQNGENLEMDTVPGSLPNLNQNRWLNSKATGFKNVNSNNVQGPNSEEAVDRLIPIAEESTHTISDKNKNLMYIKKRLLELVVPNILLTSPTGTDHVNPEASQVEDVKPPLKVLRDMTKSQPLSKYRDGNSGSGLMYQENNQDLSQFIKKEPREDFEDNSRTFQFPYESHIQKREESGYATTPVVSRAEMGVRIDRDIKATFWHSRGMEETHEITTVKSENNDT